MIRAVLFDLDGTLYDRGFALRAFIELQFERYQGYFPTVKREDYVQTFLELDANGKVWKDRVYAELCSHFKVTEISKEHLLEDYVASFSKSCVPFSDLENVLLALLAKDYQLGLITNGRTEFQLATIEALSVAGHFEEILISEREKIAKPEAEIFHRALKRLAVSPEEAVFIGDNPIDDIAGAKGVGMFTIWKRNGRSDSVPADATIDNLSEIPQTILSMSN